MYNPKISIITAAYNSAATIEDTLRTVAEQEYPRIEHIVVDGLSTDGTAAIVKKFPGALFLSGKDDGLYDAINKGIRASTGDIVGILNSDDFFPNAQVISTIARAFQNSELDAVYGNIAFVKPGNLKKIIRLYQSGKFKPEKFKYGYMPAHPSFYARKSCFEKYGYYHTDYQIAADYELLMRFMYTYKIRTRFIDKILVYMRTGGVSNQTWKSRLLLNREIVKACKANGVRTNIGILGLKYFFKIGEYIRPRVNPQP